MPISTSITSSSPPLFSTNLHQPPPPPPSSSSCKFISSNEVVSITAAKEAVELASAALEAAREAALLTYDYGVEDDWFDPVGNGDLIDRRKKRRKRRKGFAFNSRIEDATFQNHPAVFGPVNGGYLTPVQEAQLSQCLRDETRLEVTRRSIAEVQDHEPTLQQLAKAMKTKNSSISKIMQNGRVSRAVIIHNYHRLVASIAHSYKGKGLTIQDLIQEGCIGLLRGAEKFDPNRGSKLSTYAYWWIKEAIISSVSNKSRVVRLPRSMQDKITKIAQAKVVLREKLGRVPSYEEIAEMLNVHVSTVICRCQMSRSPFSLDRNVGDEGSMTLKEIIAGPDEILPEKMLKKELMKNEMEKLIETISEREAQILRLRFGLNGETPRSYEEIGRSMKLTKERIRQINEMALSNIRHRTNLDDLKMYI